MLEKTRKKIACTNKTIHSSERERERETRWNQEVLHDSGDLHSKPSESANEVSSQDDASYTSRLLSSPSQVPDDLISFAKD